MEQTLIQTNGWIMINVDVSVKNPSKCICENGKYLASIIDYSVITFDEIIYAGKTNFAEKKVICKTQFFYFTCVFINYYSVIDSY